jgi:hypothetical protein
LPRITKKDDDESYIAPIDEGLESPDSQAALSSIQGTDENLVAKGKCEMSDTAWCGYGYLWREL